MTPSPTPSLKPGTRLGPYEIASLLGAGGMGEVYRAKDPRLERDVAIKVLPEALASDGDRLRRFRDEALTASRLNHPNIIHVYDIGEQDGTRYVAMELVEGQTFEAVLVDGALPWQRLRPLAQQVLEGLTAAHEAGIVHRDLKPANLMVTDRGHVKVLDFGLAKQFELDEEMTSQGTRVGSPTMPGTALGTLGYMAPEQAKGIPADHRSDQFSLGVVIYEMATGERPFRRETPAESLVALLSETPEPLEDKDTDLPADICAAVTRCLSKNVEQRFANTAELLEVFSNSDGQVQRVPRLGSSSEELAPAPVHRTPLAGRDDELEQLAAYLDRATKGQGGLVTLVGEPGVGKTRLTEELIQRARSLGCLPLMGHCYEGEGAPPFSPWIEILERTGQISERDTLRDLLGEGASEIARIYPELRQLLPDLSPPLEMPPEQARAYLFRCFREFIERAARQQPILLVLEDLHWADDATLLLLEHLAPHLNEMPLLVLGTYRDVDLDVSRPMAKTLQQLVRQRLVEKISLQRLSEQGVASMIEGLAKRPAPAQLVKRIHHETEGNPFFVEEVYLHLEEEGRLFDDDGAWREDFSDEELDVPEGVRLVVGRRLERLTSEEQAALQAASVVGRRFSFELLATLQAALGRGGEDTLLDTVESAERLALIEPTQSAKGSRETGYRFTHELIRQTLLGSLSMPRRQRLHLRVAETIEARSSDPSKQASALAHHLYQAGAAADPEKTIAFLMLAGEQALESGAFEDALRHTDDAMTLLEDDEQDLLAKLLHQRGAALRSLGRWEECVDAWKQAVPLLAQQGEHVVMTAIALDGAFLLMGLLARPHEAASLVAPVLDQVPGDALAQRARLHAALGASLSVSGDLKQAEVHSAQASEIAEALADPAVLADVLVWRANDLVFRLTHRAEIAQLCKRIVELARETGDLWTEIEATGMYRFSSLCIGRLDQAARHGEKAAELAERLGHFSGQHHFVACRATEARFRATHLAEIEEPWLRMVELMEDLDLPYATHWKIGFADGYAFLRGDWEKLPTGSESPEDTVAATPWRGLLAAMLFLFDCYLGREDSARAFLASMGNFPRDVLPHNGGDWQVVLALVEGLSVLGEREQAAEFYPTVLAATKTGTLFDGLCSRLIETVAGIAAGAGGLWQESEEHFEMALRQAEEIPTRTEQPEVRRFYAEMLIERDQAGDRNKARALLDEAIELYREIGMPRHLEMAETLRVRAVD